MGVLQRARETEVAATTIPGTESFDQAWRDRLRQRKHG